MNTSPANDATLPAMATKPTPSGHILVMTHEQIDQLGDIFKGDILEMQI